MSYGFQVRAPDGSVTFELTTRLTTLYYVRTVGKDHSGSVYLPLPDGMSVAIQAVPTSADQHMRHVGHKMSYNWSTRRLSWSPGYNGPDYASHAAKGRILRSASRIMVFAFMPE